MVRRSKPGDGQETLPLERAIATGKVPIDETYRDYFLQYASYVITDRAIPDIRDGFKPVQRRLMHTMRVMDDGRYHKVANIIGHCMQYHPHGDASIGAALVGLGQKGLLIDTQGNWGDPVTGDPAAAARYIEARLTKFAREVLFAPHLTDCKLTYDGRHKEPLALPARFPILLALGAEGIAVGLATRVLPHNFVEIIQALKAHLRGKAFTILPDFPTGGLADVSAYNDGLPGSKVKVRAKIERDEGKAVIIREIPYGVTTTSLIESIVAASDKGNIKVAKVEDRTTSVVDIQVTFQRSVDLDKAMDALYAFTECEVTLSPNGMVIIDDRPREMGATEMITHCAAQTKELLRRDLEHQLEELEQKWHHKSLVQIFIENRIYLRIEKCKTWESVLGEIDRGLDPFKEKLRRLVLEEDLIMLTEVKMRRISAWDAMKAREELFAIDKEIGRVKDMLTRMTQVTIDWFDGLLKAYGKGRERKTELTAFDSIKAVTVVERTERLYIDRQGGFIGTALKDAEELGMCSNLDDVLVVLKDGNMQVVKVDSKAFVGESIFHAQLFKPEDRDRVYSIIYEDTVSRRSWAKRFTIGGINRDKVYNIAAKAEKPNVLFLDQAEEIYVYIKLQKAPRIKTDLYFSFSEVAAKNRISGGTLLCKHRIAKITTVPREEYERNRGVGVEG